MPTKEQFKQNLIRMLREEPFQKGVNASHEDVYTDLIRAGFYLNDKETRDLLKNDKELSRLGEENSRVEKALSTLKEGVHYEKLMHKIYSAYVEQPSDIELHILKEALLKCGATKEELKNLKVDDSQGIQRIVEQFDDEKIKTNIEKTLDEEKSIKESLERERELIGKEISRKKQEALINIISKELKIEKNHPYIDFITHFVHQGGIGPTLGRILYINLIQLEQPLVLRSGNFTIKLGIENERLVIHENRIGSITDPITTENTGWQAAISAKHIIQSESNLQKAQTRSPQKQWSIFSKPKSNALHYSVEDISIEFSPTSDNISKPIPEPLEGVSTVKIDKVDVGQIYVAELPREDMAPKPEPRL